MKTIYDNETITRVAAKLVKSNIRLDNPGLASAKFGPNGRQAYKLSFEGEVLAIPAGKLVSAYWDAVNNPTEVTAFEL
jgi:hypothetical protein